MAYPVVESWTKNNSNGNGQNYIDLSKPSGVNVGNLLIVIAGSDYDNATWASNIGQGFTRLFNHGNSTSDSSYGVWYKIADGTELSTITPSYSGSMEQTWGFYIRISGVDTTNPINATGSPTYTGDSTSHPANQCTTNVNECLALVVLAFDGGDAGSFSTSSSGWSIEDEEFSGIGSGFGACGCWGKKQVASAGGTGNVTITTPEGDGSVQCQFAIAPSSVLPERQANLSATLAGAAISAATTILGPAV